MLPSGFWRVAPLTLALALTAAMPTMSIQEAYRTIPQRQTPYNAGISRIRGAEQTYLTTVFELTDVATAIRTDAMRWLQSGARRGADPITSEQALKGVEDQLNALTPPRKLSGVHRALQGALFAHRQTIASWQRATDADLRVNMNQPEIQQAHRQIERAYRKLLTLYANEPEYNQQAFHDTLAALDFLPLKTQTAAPRP